MFAYTFTNFIDTHKKKDSILIKKRLSLDELVIFNGFLEEEPPYRVIWCGTISSNFILTLALFQFWNKCISIKFNIESFCYVLLWVCGMNQGPYYTFCLKNLLGLHLNSCCVRSPTDTHLDIHSSTKSLGTVFIFFRFLFITFTFL